ncbi:hypothetical protein HYALB_00009039 [Hymenoscyphus albidus]|uniref:Oxidoreductase-like domain-containing protein n=1 Tax=Hymenoscyphus albidus TaxID=595503 RepID=A0A9N9Q459_9HELO|nr:hypothetical protein HYALB_00009039 [Hymenoscyphus albidus]
METRFLLRLPKRIPLPQIRKFHPQQHPRQEYKQANPLGSYYEAILESSSQAITSQPPTTASPSSNPPISAKEEEEPEAPILFSSRLSSPLERRSEIKKKSTLVAGIWVPPKPDEPDDCCMSGCVNCVWDRYGDELVEWAAARKEADQALLKEKSLEKVKKKRKGVAGTGLMLGEGEKGAEHTMISMDDDGGGSESNWGTGLNPDLNSDDLFKGVPVGIREFMKQEKRLKEKRAREEAAG